MEQLPELQPDVVLLDTMAANDALGIDEVRAAAGGARVMFYSGHEPHAAQQFVAGEPDAWLRKGDEPDHLIDALRALGA
jgi:DNA-binding NarL/FixJ family response regulator